MKTSRFLVVFTFGLMCLSFTTTALLAQQQTMPEPAKDDTSFEPIFDGKSLNGWDGDTKYWRVEGGCLIGEITPGNQIQQNTFIIWRGGKPADFELKTEYRITGQGNSGINYRSSEVEGMKYVLKGYQADIDGEKRNASGIRYTGQNYEERGRTFLALRGQVTRVEEGKTPQIIASLGDTKELESFIKSGDWNEYHLIARGNLLVHILNGHTMAVVIDDDKKNRTMDGLIGVQVHVGGPMKVEYRSIKLKKL